MQQFWNLRFAEAASQTHHTSIDFVNDADPAVHNVARDGKTGATNGRNRRQALTTAHARLSRVTSGVAFGATQRAHHMP
jgi:hypothetical protein